MHFVIVFPFLCTVIVPICLAQQPEPNLVYVPLNTENKREDLDLLEKYWPLKEDAFVADLNSLQATRWAVVVFESMADASPKGRLARENEHDHDNGTSPIPTAGSPTPTPGTPVITREPSTARPLVGAGLLDNKEALDEIEYLRKYIEEDHKVTINNQDYFYKNVCLSYVSPTSNRSVCRFPEVNIVDVLDSTQRQRLWKGFQKPSLYPYYGDRGAPLGVKMMTGPVLGGVDIDLNTGDVQYVKQVALKYFFKTRAPPDGIDGIALEWRNSLRDYVLNKHRPSTIIDYKYLDDEMMNMRLDAKNSITNGARLLDPTPSSTSAGFWSNGLTAQLIFTRVPDLSRDAEVRAILKTLAAFENTPYTYGEEGTVCWIRSFIAWRKWLVTHLYGAESEVDEATNGNKKEETTPVASPSPFGSFDEDLRVFLRVPYYPVYSQHVVMSDVTGDGQSDVKAFRCFITLRNLTDPDQRTRAMEFLRQQAVGNGRYDISVLGSDFFPPRPGSAPAIQSSFVPLVMALVALFMASCF